MIWRSSTGRCRTHGGQARPRAESTYSCDHRPASPSRTRLASSDPASTFAPTATSSSHRRQSGRWRSLAWINHVDMANAPPGWSSLSPADRKVPVVLDPEILALMVTDNDRGISLDPHDSDGDADPRLKVGAALAPHRDRRSDYLDWFRIGCAIYDGLGDAGFALFDESSRTSQHYNADGSGKSGSNVQRAA